MSDEKPISHGYSSDPVLSQVPSRAAPAMLRTQRLVLQYQQQSHDRLQILQQLLSNAEVFSRERTGAKAVYQQLSRLDAKAKYPSN